MKRSELYIGLMSGTSMDGVDGVLVELHSGQGSKPQPCVTLIGHLHRRYPDPLLNDLRNAAKGAALTAQQWLTLDSQVGEHFGQVAKALLKQCSVTPHSVQAIGSHGQTVWHQPQGTWRNSWQLGDPNAVAAISGVTTVADFRRMDMANGGQGAPLVPAFHQAFFGNAHTARTILNLGGIANITVLTPSQPVLGFDTGPANCLLDQHSQRVLHKAFDENGNWAASGQVNRDLLGALMADPYFAQAAPKSTGPEYFSWAWLQQFLAITPCSGANLQATLAELTAQSCAQAISQYPVDEVIICGGGLLNADLHSRLRQALPENVTLSSSAAYGLEPQQVEAIAFAWLAKQRLAQQPGNLPSVTGADKACVLGAIYQP